MRKEIKEHGRGIKECEKEDKKYEKGNIIV